MSGTVTLLFISAMFIIATATMMADYRAQGKLVPDGILFINILSNLTFAVSFVCTTI